MQIHKEATFPVAPERVYATLTESARFATATGMPADIGVGDGATISLFGGHVEGRQIELTPNQRVVQAWRSTDWEPGVYSVVRFTLAKEGSGTKLFIDQDGHPQDWHDHLSTNWPNFYLNPFARSFAEDLRAK